MRTRAWWWADRFGVALGYTVVLVLSSGLLAARSPGVRNRWLDWASTNLMNLGTHPVGAMLSSAVLTEGSIAGWVVLALVGLGATGWVLGAWRTALLVGSAHVVGTLISEGILRYRIGHGQVPASAELIRDIGPSYLIACALVAGIAYSTWPGRLLCLVGFALLAPDLFGGLSRWEVAPVGHVCSIVIGLTLGGVLRWERRRRSARSDATTGPPEPSWS